MKAKKTAPKKTAPKKTTPKKTVPTPDPELDDELEEELEEEEDDGLGDDSGSSYEILDEEPIPTRGNRVSKYPFALLKVGQSFFVPEKTVKTFGPTVQGQKNKLRQNFTIRNTTREGVEGVQVWRTEGVFVPMAEREA